MADIVISRAGANAISEILALKKPNILIPLPSSSSRGDQLLNAKSYESQGFSIVIDEDDLTNKLLLEKIQELYFNRFSYIDAMKKSSQRDAIGTIIGLIEEMVQKSRNTECHCVRRYTCHKKRNKRRHERVHEKGGRDEQSYI